MKILVNHWFIYSELSRRIILSLLSVAPDMYGRGATCNPVNRCFYNIIFASYFYLGVRYHLSGMLEKGTGSLAGYLVWLVLIT